MNFSNTVRWELHKSSPTDKQPWRVVTEPAWRNFQKKWTKWVNDTTDLNEDTMPTIVDYLKLNYPDINVIHANAAPNVLSPIIALEFLSEQALNLFVSENS